MKKIIAIFLFAFCLPAYSARVYLACMVTADTDSIDRSIDGYFSSKELKFNILIDTDKRTLEFMNSRLTVQEIQYKRLIVSPSIYWLNGNWPTKDYYFNRINLYIDRYTGQASLELQQFHDSFKINYKGNGYCQKDKQWQPQL